MKKIVKKTWKKILLVLALVSMLFAFSACDFMEAFLSENQENPNLPEYTGEISKDTLTLLLATKEMLRKSNVKVYTRSTLGFEITSKTGSGVVFHQDDEGFYYALTNWHVIDSGNGARAKYEVSDFFEVEDTNGIEPRREATLVHADKSADLAIVKFHKDGHILAMVGLTARESVPLEAGEFLLAVGNPRGTRNVVSYGAYLKMTKIVNADFPVINHNAPIQAGSSGGALCDINGNLVGINTWGAGTSDCDNFAVPLEKVLEFVAPYLNS